MRSFSRALVVGALATPLAFGGAGLAAASEDGDKGGGYHGKCVDHSCKIEKEKYSKEYNKWYWNWDFTFVNVSDNQIINAGIINT